MARAKRAAGGRALHFDCFSGASGNMLLGALLELGASARAVRAELAALPVKGLRLRTSKVARQSLSATYVRFESTEHEHTHRSYRDIRRILKRAKLSRGVKEKSERVFHKLASVEARIHGVALDHVHFHELGAVDTLGDVIGVCAALEALGVQRISCSPIAVGHGTVKTAHGQLPLPAPATLALLRGVPTYPAQVAWETITPTGAALLATLVDEYGPMPACVPEAQGFGAGNDRPGPMPNVLRAVLSQPESGISADVVAVLETNLDDMSAAALAFLAERLMEEGALDVSLSPLSMKKGRPGQLLRVLTRPADRDAFARRILLESSAIGVRSTLMPRLVLARELRQVRTRFGRIGVKLVKDPRGQPRAAPEYEDCARAARRHKVPLHDVYRSAERAAFEEARVNADAFELGRLGGVGPALLCLHGLTGTPYEVRPPVRLFEELGFGCLGPMLPGHGCSVDELSRTPRDQWVRCALDAFDRLAATHSRVYVLGLSLGGVLALKIAQQRAVAGALVIAAPLDLGRFYRLAVPIVARALGSIGKTPAIFDAESRDRHPGYRRMPLRAVVELMRLQREVEVDLPRITAPLRLLYSRLDPTVRVEDASRILRGASRAHGSIEYLESSAHVVTVDRERERVEQWIVNSLLELEKAHELTERTSRL